MMTCLICGYNRCEPSHWKGDYLYVRCGNCDARMLDPIPEDTSAIYTEDYFSGATHGFGYVDYAADKEPMRPVFSCLLGRVEQGYPHKGRLLDVGAADGFFVDLAQRRGWTASGVELSAAAALRARSRGLRVATGDIGAVPTNERFDVITLWDVIEHVSNPVAMLAAIRERLAPGGAVALTTPDVGSLWARLMGRSWHAYIPPEHICLMGEVALRLLAGRSGFRVIISEGISKRFTIAYTASVVSHWLGRDFTRPLAWLSRSSIGSMTLRIPIYDNRFVFLMADNEAPN